MSGMRSTVRALTCPNCGGTVALRAAGHSVSMVCEHCGTTLDTTRPELAVIAKATAAMHRPEIPLGTRAELRGSVWEVVGYLERSDGEIEWSEYLLFNPYQGYAFLVDDGRRFSLGRLLDRLPDHRGGSLTVDGQGFSRFGNTYGTWVKFVVGEFYWRVAEGEHVRVTDFVTPGTMLSCEENEEERTWTRLVLLDRGEAEDAFGMANRGRNMGGTPAPHEPSPYRNLTIEALIIGLVAAMALIVIASMGSIGVALRSADMTVRMDGPMVTQVIGPIQLPDRRAAIRIQATASQLDNSWIDVDYALVDRRTQESFYAYALVEAYHGRDSDGPWREGDSNPTMQLSSIPRGTYDLVVEATGHRWQQGRAQPLSPALDDYQYQIFDGASDVPLRIDIARGGIFFSNIVLALLALLLWPAVILLLHFGFERRRMAPIGGGDED